MKKRRWQDLTSTQQVAVAGLAAVQIGLAGAAWTDLARRPAAQVNGKKSVWAAVIAINFIGPIAYFTKGRQQ